MKRWQDRGEVLDSDDEENSLDAEVQRPAKRARIAGGNVGSAQRSTETGDTAEDGNGDGGREISFETLPQIRDARGNEDDDEDWLQPKPAVTYGSTTTLSATQPTWGLRNPPASTALSATDNDAASLKPPSSHQSHIDALPEDASRDNSQLSTELGDLPDIHELLGRHDVGQADPEDLHHLISTASSPLSERDVSPSPPPLADVFHFSTSSLPVSAPTAKSTHVEPTDVTGDAQVAVENRASGGLRRRNLRTRNEKQLHPYMFDKAQYQQQCRERGMRPVRVMDAAQQAAIETQNSSNEDNDQSSQILFGTDSTSPSSSSPAVGRNVPNATDEELTVYPRNNVDDYGSDDELPDLPALIRRSALDGVQQRQERKRLFGITRNRSANPGHANGSGNHDSFSAPPSPPPTSSDPNDRQGIEHGVPKFRFPRGLTPRHSLPTPRVSSDLRPIETGDDSQTSDEDLPSRRFGLPTSSRKIIAVLSSSDPSEAEEEEPKLDEKRLHRERRRIKGVLPASWLKIDFKAQQNPQSPRRARSLRAESFSPERPSPQKGVAQRIISRRSDPLERQQLIDISDDGSDAAAPSRLSSPSPSPPRARQIRLEFNSSQYGRTRPEMVDDDDMEVDWIDPMFGGVSSDRNRPSKKRQPKIIDAFKAAPRRVADVAVERIGPRATISTASTRHKSNTNPRRSRRRYPQASRLSILDAPSPTAEPRFRQPQFVRLATRQARNRSDDGRHSPSNKQVRLATKEDTETAQAVLRAWREGTIRPRQTSPQNRRIEPNSARVEQTYHEDAPVQQPRTPLTELSRNIPRPFEHQKNPSKVRVKHVTTATRSRLYQTRLQLEASDRHQPLTEQDEPDDAAPRPLKVRQIHPTPSRAHYRGAQLESLENEFDQRHRAAAFERRMQRLTESVSRRGRTAHNERLERFLYGSTPASGMEAHAVRPDMSMRKDLEVPGPKEVFPLRHRKRIARRIDAEAREYRQPSEPLPDVANVVPLPDYLSNEPTPILQGLGLFGTRYATDFDVFPLALGTYFHQTSFIGSGDFAAALNFDGRDLDKSTGRLSIHVDGEVLEWGWWTEEVAAGLARIPRAVSEMLDSLQADDCQADADLRSLVLSNVDYLLRSVIRYLARCLAFLDAVDRELCIGRIHTFVEELFERLESFSTSVWADYNIGARCLYFILVITKQAYLLSGHRSVGSEIRSDSMKLVGRAAHRLASSVFPRVLSDLRTFYDDNRHASRREAGIRDDNISVTSMVILYHVLNEPGVQPSLFWSKIYQQLNVNVATLVSVSQFDKAWYDIFTLLPVLEMDASGIAQIGSRLHGSQVDWSLPRILVESLFTLYDASSHVSGFTINDYVRATLSRCYHLVSRWGWWRCESVLGIIFDFFARRGLAQLHREDSRGSPKFLEELKDVPSLDIHFGEPSFHIFLKLLASSLIGMCQHGVYTDKKIGGIAWRFIPNHGRTYRKDTEVKQEDLDALRNHHDLLCTLYYASPSKHRLRVDLLRNLVDHSVSHREACRLSVRSWANLAAFQTSTGEYDEHLEPFVEWFGEMLSITKAQYRHAKNEVEQDVESARARGELPVQQHIIEDTIARNQRQICATLVDLMVAVRRALKSVSSVQRAAYLLKGCAVWNVLELYDPASRRLNSVLDEALCVAQAALEVENSFSPSPESQSRSEESQDYGDSSALVEFASSDPHSPVNCESVTDLLHDPVNQLLSNLFGADAAPDDILLTKAVDIWVQLLQRKVRSGESSWTSYITGYTSASWNQLRDTAHQRKFTPYFISRMATFVRGPKVGIEILSPWLESLVEREALLSHQHTLSSNLVSLYPSEPLFKDLPIYVSATNPIIPTIQEFHVRRVELIARILFNMRRCLDTLARQNSCDVHLLQVDYAALLRKVMDAMKTRYQQLNWSNNSESTSGQEQGSYVAFVHRVISIMQECTSDICPIDSFFTDSNNFPLPSSDPTYVVGKLKAYAPKLGNSGQRKQLVMFIRTVSERAARQNQQKYLVGQLVDAMSIEAQQDPAQAFRLPHLLMTAIFPAYIEQALSTQCLWIISIPVLQACGQAIEQMLYQVDFQNQASVVTVAEIITAFFRSMITTVDYALADSTRMESSHTHMLCSALFDAARLCVTMAHHVCKKCTEDAELKQMLGLFAKYAEEVEAAVMSNFGVLEVQRYSDEIPRLHCRWADTLEFTRTVALGASFSQNWYTENGRVFMRRGSSADEITLPLEDGADQRVKLLVSITYYRESRSRIFGGGETQRCSRRQSRVAFGVASELVIL